MNVIFCKLKNMNSTLCKLQKTWKLFKWYNTYFSRQVFEKRWFYTSDSNPYVRTCTKTYFYSGCQITSAPRGLTFPTKIFAKGNLVHWGTCPTNFPGTRGGEVIWHPWATVNKSTVFVEISNFCFAKMLCVFRLQNCTEKYINRIDRFELSLMQTLDFQS